MILDGDEEKAETILGNEYKRLDFILLLSFTTISIRGITAMISISVSNIIVIIMGISILLLLLLLLLLVMLALSIIHDNDDKDNNVHDKN